jgi:nitroreductase
MAARNRIEGAKRFVHQQDTGLVDQRAGNRQALTLTAGELRAVLADHRLQTLRQLVDEFERMRLARAPLVIAVVSRAGPHVKIPEWEQQLSAGAAAMNLVNAAHAMGYAASWITEWYAYDRAVLDALGLAANERVAGFVHVGRPAKAPEERDRPKLGDIVSRFQA